MDYSVLSFPTRYTFFYIYLLVLVNCLIMRLAFLKKSIEITYNALSRSYCANKIHKICFTFHFGFLNAIVTINLTPKKSIVGQLQRLAKITHSSTKTTSRITREILSFKN